MSEYLMRALLKTKLDEWLKTDMEDWYATFGRAMSNGELTDEEIDDLNKQWEELVKKASISATAYRRLPAIPGTTAERHRAGNRAGSPP